MPGTIKQRVVAVTTLTTLFLIALSGAIILQSWRDIQAAVALQKAGAARNALVHALLDLSLERSVSQLSVTIDPTISKENRALIDHQRLKADASLQHAASIGRDVTTSTEAPKFVSQLGTAMTRLKDLRGELDEMTAQPIARRPAGRVESWPKEFKTIISEMMRYSYLLRGDGNDIPSRVVLLENLEDRVWETREYAGRERTWFAWALATGRPIDAQRRAEMDDNHARSSDAWTIVGVIARQLADIPEIESQVALVNKDYFGSYLTLREALREAGASASPRYPISFQDYFEQSSRSLAGITTFADTAAEEVQAVWAELIDAAKAAMIRAAVVMLAALLLGAASILIVTKGALSRFARIRETMDALAGGQKDVVVPGLGDRDEIGAMAKCVEVFRVSAQKLSSAEDMAEQAERLTKSERARKALEDELRMSLGVVVAAARAGDFSKRADASAELGALREIVEGFNVVVSTCDVFLDETDRALQALAEGDLTARMPQTFQGRLGAVAANFNAASAALMETVGSVALASGGTRSAAVEIAAAMHDISSRTEQQALALEEMTATVEELARTSEVTAGTAGHAAQLARGTASQADRGSQLARDAMNAMDKVESQTGKIVAIVDVMDDLAFQTNLLALNASVEAARAGEAGRGFAVVAVEVRRLAQQSADAAKGVRTLVAEVGADVKAGAMSVKTVGGALEEIVGEVVKIAGTFGEIAGATREQATGIAEIANSATSIDAATQASASATEETASAASQLEDTAQSLNRTISRFRLDGSPRPHSGASARKAA